MARRITVDPVTRIEGHLRIDCQVDNGKITNAWSSGQMWRGIETILQGLSKAVLVAVVIPEMPGYIHNGFAGFAQPFMRLYPCGLSKML